MNSFRKMLLLTVFTLAVSAVFLSNVNYGAVTCPGGCDASWTGNFVGETHFGDGADDCMYGKGGSDRLHGMDGEDCIEGGSGNDFLYGGCDQDDLKGGLGYNKLYFHPGDNDQLNVGWDGEQLCSLIDCAGGSCQNLLDFRIKAGLRPVSTGNSTTLIGNPETINFIIIDSPSKVPESLKGVNPSGTVIKYFAKKGHSDEQAGLSEIPDTGDLASSFEHFTIEQDPKNEDVLIVKIPAYTKEESRMAAAELFNVDGNMYTMYDFVNGYEMIISHMEYIKFPNTALIPIQ